MTSLVVMPGTIHRPIQFEADQARFSLKNENGLFFINASGPAQLKVCQVLNVGDLICVIARLHGYRNRTCGKHHVYLEAMAIMTLDQEHDFFSIWRGLDLPAFDR